MRASAGLFLLATVASCQPHQQTTTAIPPKVATATMLKRLALDVPADVEANLPQLTEAGEALALPVTGARPFFALSSTQSPNDAARAIDCMTAAIYYEARSQSDDGERAVAQVVLNRVRDRAFPNTVCGVVYQGSQRRTGCQFSFTCDGSMAFRRDERAWARARNIAVAMLSGEVYAPVGSATFYHANYVLPWWASSMQKVATVGAHIFYRWSTSLERALANSQSYAGNEPSLYGRTTPLPVAGTNAMAAVNGGFDNQEVVAGVVIHRGGKTQAAPVAAVVSAPVTAAATTPASFGKRVKVIPDTGGVRVHRGQGAPMPDDTTPGE